MEAPTIDPAVCRSFCENACEVLKAATPALAVAGVVAGAARYLGHKWNWNQQVLQHCQQIDTRQTEINMMILAAASISSLVMGTCAIQLGVSTVLAVCSIMLFTASAYLLLNTLVNNKLTQDRMNQMI